MSATIETVKLSPSAKRDLIALAFGRPVVPSGRVLAELTAAGMVDDDLAVTRAGHARVDGMVAKATR